MRVSDARFLSILACCAVAVIASLVSGCTCASRCARGEPGAVSARLAARFQRVECFPNPAVPWEVHVTRTDGPPVLLLHDISGPHPACLELAARLSRAPERYRVYMPVFFGRWGRTDTSSFAASIFFNPKGWNVHTPSVDEPSLPALGRLCHSLRCQNGGRRVLVIGNCMTGGVAVALLRNPDVAAAVTAEPAAPYAFWLLFPSDVTKKSLDVSPDTLRRASARAATLKAPALLGFHYYRDVVVPGVRMAEIARIFKGSFSGIELCEFKEGEKKRIPAGFSAINTCDSSQHSVLIDPAAGQRADYPAVYERLVDFLNLHSGDESLKR